MRIPMYQIDAFTDSVFSGNPAAVCLLPEWPHDALLQAIAAENNLSETAFLVPDGNDYDYRLRWFTPVTEVDLCGHATLAAAHVVFNHLAPAVSEAAFDTRSGVLTVWRESDRLAMAFPALPPAPCACPNELLDGLGRLPKAALRSSYYLAVFETENEVRTLRPRMDLLARLDLPVVIATARGSHSDFVSRCFGPKVGIPEDPVTGSAHCILAPFWAAELGKTGLHARQVSPRGGELWCELAGDRVLIAGQTAPFLRGEVEVPWPTTTSITDRR
jgi:predicted PhzF superfamily epimerase YddE/YHI9